MKNKLFAGYKPGSKRLICIDSDGCVFDTMELKHKECFCPATIQAWGLQPISKYVREAWEFANLYSKDRGRSRFHVLLLTFDLLADREEVRAYGVKLPDIAPLREWVETAPLLNNSSLAGLSDNPVMKRTLDWSLDINKRTAEMVHGVPPFPGVRESLGRLSGEADIVIVSATAREALEHEWAEHDLMQYVRLLCAQEDGSKKEVINALRDHYPPENILMIGDAPGDLEAAKDNGVLFYPICPGKEIASWRIFRDEAADRFLSYRYTGAYEQELLARFDGCLSDTPPWKHG